MSILLCFIYCLIILLILVFSSLAIIYKQHLNDCSEPSNPWCWDDWNCKISTNINNTNPGLLDAMKAANIVSQDAAPGSSYNVKIGIVDQYQTQCSSTSIYDPVTGEIDNNKIVLLNPITGETCEQIGPQCKMIPKGCVTNLYGESLNKDMIWGISQDFS